MLTQQTSVQASGTVEPAGDARPAPLRIEFHGFVVRCDGDFRQIPDEDELFGYFLEFDDAGTVTMTPTVRWSAPGIPIPSRARTVPAADFAREFADLLRRLTTPRGATKEA